MSLIEKVGSPQLYLEKFIHQQTEVDKLRQNQRGFLLTRPIFYAIALGAIANIGSLFYSYSETPHPTQQQEADILNTTIMFGVTAAIAGLALGILHQAIKARSEASKSLNLAFESLRNFELYYASTQSSNKSI